MPQQIILEPPLPSKDLRVSLPLVIGSVPLRNRFSSFLPPEETRKPSSGLPGVNYSKFRKLGSFSSSCCRWGSCST